MWIPTRLITPDAEKPWIFRGVAVILELVIVLAGHHKCLGHLSNVCNLLGLIAHRNDIKSVLHSIAQGREIIEVGPYCSYQWRARQ